MKKIFGFIATFLLVLTSCTQEDCGSESAPMSKIQASFEESLASRLAVGEENVLTWSNGDAFTMFNSDGESSKWTLEDEGGKTDGVFGGMELEGTIKGAAFPASATPTLTGGYELTMTLPNTLAYEEGICNLPMWASFSSLEGNISFKHLGALLKIDFTNLPKDYTSIIVTANKAIAGVFTTNISNEEPVLSLKENGSKSVTITFDAISEEDNDRLFYLPLPVGIYGSINVSISDGENTISIADWKDRTIERKKVYCASLTYRELSGDVTSEIITQTLSEMATVTSNATLEIVNELKAEESAITIPSELSKVNINFATTPKTSDSAPLKIEEDANVTTGTQLTVTLPAETTETYLEVNTPTTTVNVEGGNYKRIVATTADNTLILREGTIVVDLVVVAGNISFKGGKVTGTITRHDSNTGEVTYIYIDSLSDLLNLVLGEKFEVVMPDYLTFKAEAEQTFSLSKEVETFEYSVNGTKWTDLGTNTITFGGEKGELRLRGKSLKGSTGATISFGEASVLVAASGDIRTLVDYEKYTDDALDTSNAYFAHLFKNCTVLTSSPKLPIQNLSFEAYACMFEGCTNLTKAPELPAITELSWGCYYAMFKDCTSLESAPALPAAVLGPNCYSHMFYGCTSLTEAPVIAATTTAQWACYNMFYGCTSLTKAPELPATKFDGVNCYQNMFMNCTNLTEAPELPATTLSMNCYSGMFRNCTSLTNAPELPATTLADYCYQRMFEGCTSLTQASELPATTLAKSCYLQMFYGCTSLTKAPVLPATKLENYCYAEMFRGCTSLNEVTMLATELSEYSNFTNWLEGVSATGTFTKSPEMHSLPSGGSGIPEGWTVIGGSEIASDTPYLCFSANSEQTLSLSKAVETLEYSVGGGEWIELGTNAVLFGGEKGDLRLRGKSATGTGNANISFADANVPVASTGDIRTLVDYENLDSKTLDTSTAAFQNLFKNCTVLTSAPKLPATTLAFGCYNEMFAGCTSLNEAPELPATTLNQTCYYMMFEGCTSLVKAPALPATNLAFGCYRWMFANCSNLVNAPALPAIVVPSHGYQGMFEGCSSLTEAPKLPATSIDVNAYYQMFAGCTNLTEAPEIPVTTMTGSQNCMRMFYNCTSLIKGPEILPATTLTQGCYASMFLGCTSLTEAPELPATTMANSCYADMFSDCTNLKKAPELPATTLATSCYARMFVNCTNLTEAPTLPATTLAEKCYYSMFNTCTSLTKAPELPAMTMTNKCYFAMFIECTSLAEAPELPATTLANDCYASMFDGCVSLTKAPTVLPATTLATNCYNSMFSYCTSLNKAPELPATTLADGCYGGMFINCTNLNNVMMLATDISAKNCISLWLDRVASIGTFYKNANVEDVSLYGIPEGWEVKNYTSSSNAGGGIAWNE